MLLKHTLIAITLQVWGLSLGTDLCLECSFPSYLLGKLLLNLQNPAAAFQCLS